MKLSPFVSIIIPSRFTEHLNISIPSLLTYTKFPKYKIIIVDNGLSVPRKIYNIKTVEYISYNKKKFVFSSAINQAIAARPHDDIIVFNDDAQIQTCNWISFLRDNFRINKQLGMVAPVLINNIIRRKKLIIENKAISFIAAYIPREVINKVGLLDENYTGYGFEDIDYAVRLWKYGYEIGRDHTVWMNHGVGKYPASTSFKKICGKNFKSYRAESQKYFFEKWSDEIIEGVNYKLKEAYSFHNSRIKKPLKKNKHTTLTIPVKIPKLPKTISLSQPSKISVIDLGSSKIYTTITNKRKQNKRNIDITLTSVLRPELLEQTLDSFCKYLFTEQDRYTLIMNVDPIGSEGIETDQERIKEIAIKYFNNIIINYPTSPNFAAAVKWCWSQTTSKYVFHLEDDWLLNKFISINKLIKLHEKFPKVATIRLCKQQIPKTKNKCIIFDAE